jgi:hypothetical protein
LPAPADVPCYRRLDKAGHELQKMFFGVLDRCAAPSTDLDRYPLDNCMLVDFSFFPFLLFPCVLMTTVFFFSSPFDPHELGSLPLLACMGLVFSFVLPDMLCWRQRPPMLLKQYIVIFHVLNRKRTKEKVDFTKLLLVVRFPIRRVHSQQLPFAEDDP